MLMQESIKEVINIHKCKIFFLNFMWACGPARGPRANPCGPRAYAGWARAGLRAHYPGPPHVFSAGRARGPGPNCHPYLFILPRFKNTRSQNCWRWWRFWNFGYWAAL